jgi:hypothetical protein
MKKPEMKNLMKKKDWMVSLLSKSGSALLVTTKLPLGTPGNRVLLESCNIAQHFGSVGVGKYHTKTWICLSHSIHCTD